LHTYVMGSPALDSNSEFRTWVFMGPSV